MRSFPRASGGSGRKSKSDASSTKSISERLEEARLKKEKMEQAERMEKQGPMSIFGKNYDR